MADGMKGTGDGHSYSHDHRKNDDDHDDERKKNLDQTASIKISSVFASGLLKMVFPSLVALALTFMGYYLNANYMPRKEVEEKYVNKYEYAQMVKEIETIKIKMVDRDLYDAKIAYIAQSLERIEKSLEENNKDYREILRALPKHTP